MFRGIEQQIINRMMLEINECNQIVEWFIEGTKIPKEVHRTLTLKSILQDEYFDQISGLIVKSIFFGRHIFTCMPVGQKPHQTKYELLIIPREDHIIIDIKRIDECRSLDKNIDNYV